LWRSPLRVSIIGRMSDVTQILSQIDASVPHAANQLLPLVYDELRKLAAAKLAQENPGQTLQATALVHEAYLRLVGDQRFANRHHFFASAAQAMRRILIESARRKQVLAVEQLRGIFRNGSKNHQVSLRNLPSRRGCESRNDKRGRLPGGRRPRIVNRF
jgi:RNA polymerase sigma factor (TIGR02999 family)